MGNWILYLSPKETEALLRDKKLVRAPYALCPDLVEGEKLTACDSNGEEHPIEVETFNRIPTQFVGSAQAYIMVKLTSG
jgi:hypothetical protein